MKADKVLILSGVYREHVNITVSGEAGRPITFAAAPGHRVVVKGSEIVRGPWTRLSPQGRRRGQSQTLTLVHGMRPDRRNALRVEQV